MTSPTKPKLLTPALITALVALAVLAAITIYVVVRDDGTEGGSPGASATSSDLPGEAVITSDAAKASYARPSDGYDEAAWHGPETLTIGGVQVDDAVSYPACESSSGLDSYYGFVLTSGGDLADEATAVATALADAAWTTGDPKTKNPSAANEQTTDGGVTGQLVETEVARTSGADPCGSTIVHVGAFAFENPNGDVVVLVGSYRTDGDIVRSVDELTDDTIRTMKSLALV